MAISTSPEESKVSLCAFASLVLAYFAFPIAMGLGYVAMALSFLMGLFAWRSLSPHVSILKSPLVIATIGLYALILLGWAYSDAPLDDITLHLSKYAKLILVPVFILLLQNQ
ncbi:MAG: hypothetical protein ACN6NT_07100, partial [Comamonas sp.]